MTACRKPAFILYGNSMIIRAQLPSVFLFHHPGTGFCGGSGLICPQRHPYPFPWCALYCREAGPCSLYCPGSWDYWLPAEFCQWEALARVWWTGGREKPFCLGLPLAVAVSIWGSGSYRLGPLYFSFCWVTLQSAPARLSLSFAYPRHW